MTDILLEGDLRRSSRRALLEIPETVSLNTRLPPASNPIFSRARYSVNNSDITIPIISITETRNVSNRRSSITPLYNSIMTPSPSPDELVIQQRGRKSLPLVWSPDIDKNKMIRSVQRKQTPTTPLSRQSTPNIQSSSNTVKSSLLNTSLRRTPRKRLLLDDSFDSTTTNNSNLQNSSVNQKKLSSMRKTRLQMRKRTLERQDSTSSITSSVSIISNTTLNSPDSSTSSENNESFCSASSTSNNNKSNNDSISDELKNKIGCLSEEQLISLLKHVLDKNPNILDEIYSKK